jgi:hypothetical protein
MDILHAGERGSIPHMTYRCCCSEVVCRCRLPRKLAGEHQIRCIATLFGKGRVRQSPHILRCQLRSCGCSDSRSAFGRGHIPARKVPSGSASESTAGALLLSRSQELLRTPGLPSFLFSASAAAFRLPRSWPSSSCPRALSCGSGRRTCPCSHRSGRSHVLPGRAARPRCPSSLRPWVVAAYRCGRAP